MRNLHKVIASLLMLCFLLSININSSSQFKKLSINSWKGIASYYHHKFNGRKTSTGEIFNNTKLTCANNFLKLGTLIKVSNPKNGKSVIVKVNDRMSAHNKRLIDLSQAAAKQIGIIQQGLGHVIIEVLGGKTDELAIK